jgi:uncharacterized membrane protein
MRRSIVLGTLALAATLSVAAPAQADPSCTWTWTDLPVPANMLFTMVQASDGHGTYAGTGYEDWSVPDAAVLWQNGAVTSLGAAFGVDTTVYDVNSDGVVVGQAGEQPVRYRAGQWEHLPMPAGYRDGAAMRINDNGDVVGGVGGRVIVWPATGGYQLLTVPIVTSYASPTDIASDGTVSLWASDSWNQGRQASFLRALDGTWTTMTSPNPTDDVHVAALNDDIAVGSANHFMTEWDRTGAVVRTYPTNISAFDVNAAGQILASGMTIWRAGVQEAELPSTIDGQFVTGIAIDDDGAVVGQRSSSFDEVSRPVVAHCA